MTAADSAEMDRAAADPAADVHALRARIREEPGLILDDPATMKALIAADDARSGRQVIDLRGAMVARLEARLETLERTHRSVVAAAYENMAGADQIHRAALAALAPRRFGDLLAALEEEIPDILGVDAIRLCLEGEEGAAGDGVLVALAPGEVDAYLQLDRPGAAADAAMRLTEAAAAAVIFGDDAPRIRSEAVVRLDFGEGVRPGMLVFGAEEPTRFSPDQGADLILFFGGLMARAIRRWVA